jgi:hypothetical protein
MMQDQTFLSPPAARITALFGLAAVALSVVPNFFLGGATQPDLSASTQTIASWARHGHDTMMLGAYLDTLAQLLLFVFVVLLVRRAEPGGGLLSTLTVAGFVVALGLQLLAVASSYGYLELARHTGDLNSVRDLYFLERGAVDQYGIAGALLFSALGILVLRSRVLPLFLGWWMLGLAAVNVIQPPLTIVSPAARPIGFVTFLLSLLWVVAASIVLLRQPAQQVATREPTKRDLIYSETR